MENDFEDDVQGFVINQEDKEISSLVIGDWFYIVQMINVDGDILFQNISVSDREIVQDEILEVVVF